MDNDNKNETTGQEAYLDAKQLEEWIARDYESIDILNALRFSGTLTAEGNCLAVAEIEALGKRILNNRLLAIRIRWEVAS